jgi:N-methylhydantoinase A
MAEAPFALALDVGGTFTDVILAERSGRRLWVTKSASVPGDPAAGFFGGADKILAQSGANPDAIARVLHGSTVATNAILEGKGARTGLVTTAGFRHVLEIGRAEIPRAANLFGWIKPKRPVPPRNVFEVAGRIRLDGSEVIALDEAALETVAAEITARGLEAPGRCCAPACRGWKYPSRSTCCRCSANTNAPRRRRSTPRSNRWSGAISGGFPAA